MMMEGCSDKENFVWRWVKSNKFAILNKITNLKDAIDAVPMVDASN